MDNDKEFNRRVLVITSSGGGGLLQAAKAKMQEVRRSNPDAKIVYINIMKDWTWKFVGKWLVHTLWDNAQKSGNVKRLEWLTKQQKYAEYLFRPTVFFNMLRELFRNDPTRIIDTQPFGAVSAIKAIRIYNYFRKKNLIMEKVIVDLPTRKAKQYFDFLKKLSKKDRGFVKVITIEPLLEEEKSADEFWLKYAGVPEEGITYEKHFIREAFHEFIKKTAEEDMDITISTKNLEEKKLTLDAANKGAISFTENQEKVTFSIQKNDIVFTLLLGSQPAFSATICYARKVIEWMSMNSIKNRQFHVFVFCANHKLNEKSLLKELSDLVLEIKDFPKNLSIVPVSFQNEEVIAPIFHRSDMTCTRSGGQTSMELMNVMNGKIWVHSETKMNEKRDPLTMKELLSGIPGWESGNASYLVEKAGADIVTPCSFEDDFAAFMQKKI